tara:strand:+ start:3698 stop:4720 length:1023 start_codon:yes stop_codon:yes gene_type:complete
MAKFINRQEEVIQIELTPYGKRAFSQGKFSPQYYAFYDDDILYDREFGPSGSIQYSNPKVSEEKQNDIVTRIKETPRLEIFSDTGWAKNYKSWEASGESSAQIANIANPNPNQSTPATSKFLRALGTGDPAKDYAPAWQIKTVNGSEPLNISGTEGFPYRTGASGSEVIVPFFSASLPLEYDKHKVVINVNEDGQVVRQGGTPVTESLWEITKDGRLLLDVEELNTYFKGNGNFDIEVFKAPKREQGNQKTMTKLMFINDKYEHADNLIAQTSPDDYYHVLAGDEPLYDKTVPFLDESYVEYFLSIRTDDDIDIADDDDDERDRQTPLADSEPFDPCEEP